MFEPVSIDLIVYKGSTFKASFVLTQDGLPFDLDGWSARMQIRETIDSATVVSELTTENGGITIDHVTATDGTTVSWGYTLLLSATATAAISVSSGVYDIELVNSAGEVGRIQGGSVSFDPEVTR